MKKFKDGNDFKIFIRCEVLFSKIISSVIVFFIIISLINIRGIGVEEDFLNESVNVSKRMIISQIWYMRAFSAEILTRMFVVDTNEGEGVVDRRARVEVEEEMAIELAKIAKRFGEGASGDGRGERAGDGNSLMASIGCIMVSDVYERDRAIFEEASGRGDRYIGGVGIIKESKDVGDEYIFMQVMDSILMGEKIKEKGMELLLAKELSKIDIWNKGLIKIGEGIKRGNRLSLLKR